MATELRTELQEFQEFVTDQLRNGGAELTPEEVLGEYRMFHPTPEQHAANVEAVKEALRDMENGDRGRPVEDVLRELREELGIAVHE
jgi:hypothetical protein